MKKLVKIVSMLLAILLLCSCGATTETVEKSVEVENVEQTPEVTATPEPQLIKTVVSNNSPYDEGEDTTNDFSELLGSSNGIEIYGKNNITFNTPADGVMPVVLLIKNTNDYSVQMVHGQQYDVTSDNFSGSLTNYYQADTIIMHPNGSDLIIEPNSELTAIFDVSLPNFNNQEESVEGDLIFTYDFRFNDYVDGINTNEVADIVVSINSYIKYSGRNERSDANNRNATIKGRVVDVNSNPVSGVDVEIANGIDEGLEIIQTNENGEFELRVTANKSSATNMWHECLLVLKHPSYSDNYICIYPKADQTNEVEAVMMQPTQRLNYTNTAVVDLGIQAYSYDTDANNSVIAFTPFHSGLNYENIRDKVNLNFTDFDGNTLFSYHLNAETPWVCVSDDGQYIVTAQATEEGNDNSTYVNVLNTAGEVVYTANFGKEVNTPDDVATETIHSRCAELSHDNKYLVVGSDDGDFWVVDWQTNTVLWQYKTHGQVRNILFNDDNSILLVSSGDSFMYGFDIQGNLIFKTYVGSWATDMELADNYLAYTLKTGWGALGCIDITSGEIVWKYETLARGSGLAISKDKKYVWWGNDVSSAYSVINNAVFDLKTGEIAYVLNHEAGQEGMYSADGRYLVVKTATTLQMYETENYTCVMYYPVIQGFDVNTTSINQTVAVNADASKIVAAFNNDPSERIYGQAYYFALA